MTKKSLSYHHLSLSKHIRSSAFFLLALLEFCLLLWFPVEMLAAEINCEPDYPDQCSPLPLDWDWQNTTIQIEPTSSGTIAVIGGKGPYTWTISGNGFYLDEAGSLKTVTTVTPIAAIYTNNACGPCEVTVTDTCGSTVRNSVRSSKGLWVEVAKTTQVAGLKAIPHTDFSHVYLPCADEKQVWCMMYSSSGPTYLGVGENGRYQVANWRYHKYYGSVGTYGNCSAAACSSNPPGFGHLEDVPGFPYNWCWLFGGDPPMNCDFIQYRWVFEWRCN